MKSNIFFIVLNIIGCVLNFKASEWDLEDGSLQTFWITATCFVVNVWLVIDLSVDVLRAVIREELKKLKEPKQES